MAFRIVILGGYGNFGARIARALSRESNLSVTIAGRDVARSLRFIESLGSCSATLEAAFLDVSSAGFGNDLRKAQPDLVIHTAGPFQAQDYAVVHAALSAGAHYIDLSDGREFVCGIGALDAMAREYGRAVISGASSVPALSAAVIDAHAPRFQQIDVIDISIAPGKRAPRGLATAQAVLDYCGKPVRYLEHGIERIGYGWQRLRRERYPQLGYRWKALVDVPDLELFPRRYPGVSTVVFSAALESTLSQWGMWTMAGLVRSGVVANWRSAAGPLLRLERAMDAIGGDAGGMLVQLSGRSVSGQLLSLRWFVYAPHGHGPEIPSMPAILLARKLMQGELHAVGAQPCVGLLKLEDFYGEFAQWDMRWSEEENT